MSVYPSHIYSELISDFRDNVITLSASASSILDIDMNTAANMQFLVDVTYPDGTDGTTTGTSLDLYQIFGNPADSGLPSDPLPYKVGGFTSGVKVSDTVEAVTMVTMPTGQGSSTNKKTSFYINDIGLRWPRGVRMVFTNTDPSNPSEIRIYIEM